MLITIFVSLEESLKVYMKNCCAIKITSPKAVFAEIYICTRWGYFKHVLNKLISFCRFHKCLECLTWKYRTDLKELSSMVYSGSEIVSIDICSLKDILLKLKKKIIQFPSCKQYLAAVRNKYWQFSSPNN